MIGIYNRGNNSIEGTFIENIAKCVEPQAAVLEKLCELKEHKIAIVHTSNDSWTQLINEFSSPGYVRIRVTVGGGFSDKAPRIDENGVYIFHLVSRAGELEAEDWKTILSGLSNKKVVDRLINHENPRGLRRFFVHEVQEHLSALTILCEGYLAVHAENTDCSEDISSALELMGWAKFQKSDRYSALIREDLSEQISIVRQRQWWPDVFEPASFDNDVKKEWEDTTGEEEIPSALNGLLKAIHEGDTVVPPKIVADAYCILVKKSSNRAI